MDISELTSVINAYRALDKPNYAIMINGPWGCGKTHFIKDCLSKGEGKHVYVSLFGVSSKEQIDDKIVSDFFRIKDVSEKKIKNFGRVFEGVTKMFDVTQVSSSFLGAFVSSIKSMAISCLDQEVILVFDDLERIEMDASKALACINEYVEHNGSKAIVICDESKISDTNAQLYKEKLILYTYHIDRPTEDVVEIAFHDQNDLPDEILVGSKAELSSILNTVGCSNLRTIRLAVSCYVSLVNAFVKENDIEDHIQLDRLLFSCLAYAIGYREYKLPISTLKDFTELSRLGSKVRFRENRKASNDKNVEPWDGEGFYDKVVSNSNRAHLVYVISAYKKVCMGYLDYQALLEDVKILNPAPSAPEMNVIYGSFGFSNDDFKKKIQSVIGRMNCKEIEFSSAQELCNFVCSLHHVVRNHGFECRIESLENDLKVFVEDILDNHKYGSSETWFSNTVKDGLGIKDENKFVQKIVTYINSRVSEKEKADQADHLRKSLLLALTADVEEKSFEAKETMRRNLNKTIITKEIAIDLYGALLEATPSRLEGFFPIFRARYGSSKDVQASEAPALNLLRDKLDESLGALEASLSKMYLVKISSHLTSLIDEKD